ncbi:MAG: ABC-2 transporter permease [Bacillus cereus]|jgi:hypothetical protein|nr:ABC-2 transporter permease [Bacillus cereus]
MIGLLRKDIMLITKNFSPIYFIAITPPIVVSLNNPDYFLFMFSITLAFLIAIQVPTTMELDEKVNWKKIVMSMPINTNTTVLSKYFLTLIMAIISGISVALVSLIYTKSVNIIYIIIAIILVIMYNAVVIPVSYKFGTSKSRYFVIFFVCIPVLFSYLFKKLNINFNEHLLRIDIKILYTLLFCVGVLLIILSIITSIKALDKKN